MARPSTCGGLAGGGACRGPSTGAHCTGGPLGLVIPAKAGIEGACSACPLCLPTHRCHPPAPFLGITLCVQDMNTRQLYWYAECHCGRVLAYLFWRKCAHGKGPSCCARVDPSIREENRGIIDSLSRGTQPEQVGKPENCRSKSKRTTTLRQGTACPVHAVCPPPDTLRHGDEDPIAP